MEKKFGEWALRVFGGKFHSLCKPCVHLAYPIKERNSERREIFTLSDNALAQILALEAESSPQASPPDESTQAASSQNSSTGVIQGLASLPVTSQKSSSPTTVSQKPAPRPRKRSRQATSKKSTPQPPVPGVSPPTTTVPQVVVMPSSAPDTPVSEPSLPTPQHVVNSLPSTVAPSVNDNMSSPPTTTLPRAVVTPSSALDTPVSEPSLPTPQTVVNSLPSAVAPSINDNMSLVTTAVGVHQLLSQVARGMQPAQGYPLTPSESPATDPSQQFVNPSQLSADPSQVVVEPPQHTIKPSETVPPQSYTSTLPPGLAPKVSYRARGPAHASRRDSIDGTPDIIVDLVDSPMSSETPHQAPVDDDAPEITVDLRDYIDLESDSDDGTHVSSSQKTADGSRKLSPPSSVSRQQHSGVKRAENVSNQAQSSTARTHPVLNVDEEDLPTWMLKKGQWKYIASTAGGPTWEKLLNLYMQQERRLEFTELVGDFTSI